MLIPSMIALFKRRYPKIPLILRSNTIRVLEQMMLKGDPEIAVTSSQAHSADLASELCIPLKLVAFAASGYRVLRQGNLTLSDLETLPLIVRDNRDARGPIETLLLNIRKQGYRPNVVMRCESPEAVKAAVMRKLGIGILYQSVISEELTRGRLKLLRIPEFPFKANTYVIYNKHRPLSACGEAFLNVVREWCEARKRGRHFEVVLVLWLSTFICGG